MTLRKKTITIIGLTFLCLVAAIFTVSSIITHEGFTDIEKKEIHKDVERALNVIEDEISMLDDIARDFANADDTCAFIQNGNRAFEQTYLRDHIFSKLRVNFILFIDTGKNIIFGKSFDLKLGGETPFPRSLQEQLAANTMFTQHNTNEGQKVKGIMLFPDGPMIVSSCPILDSEGMGPIHGTLIMGRNLDYFRITHLAKMTNLSLVVHRIDDEQMPPDMKEIRSSLSAETPVILKSLNEDIIAGYASAKDIFGKPVLLFRVDQPRVVHKEGQSVLRYLLVSLFISTLVLSLVTILLLEKSVLQRLTRLIGDVKQIASEGHFVKRVSFSGKDELSNLAFEINGMMEKLEAAEKFKEETNEARYRAVVEDQTEMICRYLPDGSIIFVNDACCRSYGMEKENIIGLNFMSINQEDYEEFSRRTASLSLAHPTMTREHKLFKAGRELRWQQWTDRAIFDNQGHVIEYQSVGRDITENKQIEEERLRLAAAIEQAAEAIYVTDTDMIIQYVNPAFESLSGFHRNEIIGQHPRILKSDRHDRQFYGNIRNTLARGAVWSGRIINKRKDGSLYEVEATGSPIRDDAGTIINYLGINRDITHEVKLEAQLRQAQKMEAIGTLAGGIAHDFNNILGGIIGFTEMALLEFGDPSLRRRMEQILKASGRAKNLVNQILAFSRQSEQERIPSDINVVTKEAVKFLRSSIPTTISIATNIPSDPNTVLADPTQLHQILMNLCANASHAMREKGGVLTIGIERIDIDFRSFPAVPDLAPGRYVRLTVSDTGHGIDSANIDRIFDPFFTTKKIGEGTGLGLSVIYGIVKSYGGTVNVYSEPGKGSTFKVYLPRIKDTETTDIVTTDSIPGGTESILLVDDEEDIIESGRAMMQSLGYTVTATTSSTEALETFYAEPERFNLIITDMTMPHMTGIKLASEVRRIRENIPIILCTGYSELINEKDLATLGIQKLLMKPFFIREFAFTIREILDGKNREMMNEKVLPSYTQ